MGSIYNLRGVVGKELNEKEIKKFAKGVVAYIYKNNLNPSIIIAKDNRVTSDYLMSEVCGVLLSCGIEVNDVGVVSTPELAFLTKKFKFCLGVMITASHNSWECNGFKCFNTLGEMVDVYKQDGGRCKIGKYEKIVDFSKFKDFYIRELKNRLNSNKIKCVFDCANGATLEVVRKIFPKHQIVGNDSSGKYINDNCGSQCLDIIRAICKRNKKIGFAFDGDGDRVVAIDEKGEVIDGDKILYILATQKLGFGDKVVGTQISSLGLEISLRRLGVGLIRERVGAKYVARRMKSEGVLLGGEPCGHIFLNSNISDGVAIAIELLNILDRTGMGFSRLLSGYKEMYNVSRDINLVEVKNPIEFESVGNNVRVVVRKSGTEDMLRIFVEGESEEVVEKKVKEVEQKICGL